MEIVHILTKLKNFVMTYEFEGVYFTLLFTEMYIK